jgi:hypothetical protein
MSELGIEIKVRRENLNISLPLMTAQIKDLRSGPGMGTRRGYRFSQVVLT